ncbi:MAG TPA: class I SAM-dependent methyltransferase [Methanocorpusculum sp.]|nr:class I SAM-dependent methyltransferase [Methanocorpusculum sp.]
MYDINQIYMPAEDTFLLRDAALSEVSPDDLVLEVGTGSGEIAAVVSRAAKQTLACEINPHAAAYAHEVNGVEVVRCDLFAAVSGQFDLILFNAPYLPTAPEERMNDWLEYALDGGISGCDTVFRFLREAPAHLTPDGRILLLISSLTGEDEVIRFAEKCGLSAETAACEREEDGEELIVLKLVRKE